MKYTNTTETLLEPLNKTGAAATKASAARNLKKKKHFCSSGQNEIWDSEDLMDIII